MIHKLKRRFVLTASLAVLIVLVITLGLINYMNCRLVYRNCDKVLTFLAENDGELNDDFRWRQSDLVSMLGEEAPYRLRYFSIVLDSEGNVIDTITDHIYSVDDAEAEQFVDLIENKPGKSGILSHGDNSYGYLITEREDGSYLICVLDCTNDIWQLWKFSQYSLLFGAATLAGYVIIMTLLADRAVKPIIRNIESQKRFITNAGHELKTPISVISANAEVLEMMNGENEWTQSILKQSKRLSGLVNDFILLTRMEEMVKPELVDMSLSEAAADAVDAFRTVAMQEGKKLEATIADGIRVKATEQELPELLNVLVDNAVKYCDDKGTVRVEVSGKGNGHGAVFAVSNTYAEGKDQDYSRFFDRFYRADESHNSEKSGHGIGLSMAEGIVNLYRGKIRANWKDGIMHFTVTFP